jgi:hypothetical protein
MRIKFVAALLAAVGFLLANDRVLAQARRETPPTIVDAASAGPDFALQGEYAGWAYVSGRGNEYTGLQVVALGDGKFDAVRYRGGLPGNGWDRATKSKLSGQVEEGRLVLANEEEGFIVGNGVAVATDNAGRELGRLPRMHRTSPTMGLAPPANAMVLFGGASTENLEKSKVSPEGLLMPEVLTKMPVDAFHLHLEFRTPFMPTARGQSRGNSGVYIQRRYEVQILDSFGLGGEFNECGALYRQTPPDINMAFPPLTWQTYDIWFTPPRFDADGQTKLANARLTVLHNGVPVHWHREIIAKTGGGRPEGPEPLPIQLQDHGNPVSFRNVWIILGEGDRIWQAASTTTYRSAGCQRGLLRRLCRRCR